MREIHTQNHQQCFLVPCGVGEGGKGGVASGCIGTVTCRFAASGSRKTIIFFRRARPICNYSVARNWGRGGKQLVVLCNCLNLCNVWGLRLLSGNWVQLRPVPRLSGSLWSARVVYSPLLLSGFSDEFQMGCCTLRELCAVAFLFSFNLVFVDECTSAK